MRSFPPIKFPLIRVLGLSTALVALAACTDTQFDWDMRRTGDSLNTSQAALAASTHRPEPDARGVLSYPSYQVAVARRGDTVTSVAARVGLDAAELGRYNALRPEQSLRPGEVLALPRRVAESATGTIVGAPIQTQGIDVTTLASGAIDRAESTSTAQPGRSQPTVTPPAVTAAGAEPVRHKVKRGETAFSIARSYSVSVRALADWNGLDANMGVREGQYLMIPVAAAGQRQAAAAVTPPGAGSPTPVPPSASQPLPTQNEPAVTTSPQGTPASPALGQQRTSASAARYAMPVDGKIIRGYAKGKNEGIDIAAPAGTVVRAASDGTVVKITKDTNGVPFLIIRNADNLLTVYSWVDPITVTEGEKVKRGQSIAKVRAANPSFLHFELRNGLDSLDPMPYLQ
ncbi:MAG: peptidoglycan DD-metalloendopeptidase family protein [Pseudorhodobacter sp.]|nr:peptidoglycan DD-metalloendopeptidase family protein [Pseudorhodobacter sp.]